MSSKENPFNLTEAEMEESRKIANSPEMKAMMDRAREQDILEEAERSRKFEEAKIMSSWLWNKIMDVWDTIMPTVVWMIAIIAVGALVWLYCVLISWAP